MIVDRYTRAVLTVIAGCLLWMCAMGTGRPVAAQQSVELPALKGTVQPVVLVGTGTMDRTGNVEVHFTGLGRTARTDPTVPVTLPYTPAKPMPSQVFFTAGAPLPVEIAAVKKTGEWEPIRVRVEDAPVRTRPGGGQR